MSMDKSGLKKYLITLISISILALIIRIIAGWQIYSYQELDVQNPRSTTDMHTYTEYAKQMVKGEYTAHQGAYYYQPFYYAVFLRSLFTVFGSDPLVIVFAQALLGALTVLLTGLIGAKLGGKKAGIVAAIMMTLFRNHILYTPYALMAVLQTFLITLSVYLVFEAFKKKKLLNWGLVGLVMSCSILTRGNFLLLIPFIVFFIWRSEKESIKKVLLSALVFLAMVYIPQLPFSIKNYQVKGEWTGPSIAGDVVIGIGNNPDAPAGTMDEEYQHYIHYDSYDEFTHWQKVANNGGKPLGDSVKSWIVANPLEWVELKFRVLSLYLSNNECYNNITLKQNAKYVPWLNSLLLLDFWIVAIPFFVLFLRVLVQRDFKKRRMNLALTCVVVYTGSIVLFYVLSRYKLPIIPLMAACAGAELVRWRHILTAGNKRRKIILAFTLIFATFVIARWFDIYYSLEPSVMNSLRPQGTQFESEKSIYIKDHPNANHGGWEFELVKGDMLIKKSFVVQEDLTSKGNLRIMLYGEVGTVVKIIILHAGKKIRKDHTFKLTGWNWLEVPLDKIVSQKRVVDFEIELNAVKDVAVRYTTQRNYHRSLKNGQAMKGEWVMQLRIDK